MKRSAPLALEMSQRPCRDTYTSDVRVRTLVQEPPPPPSPLSRSSHDLNLLQESSTFAFSCCPLPTAPGSEPPCPASMQIFAPHDRLAAAATVIAKAIRV